MSTDYSHWQSIGLAGHACQVYAPGVRPEHSIAVVYLHDQIEDPSAAIPPPIRRLIEEHGLSTVVPIAPGAWWGDRVYSPFDRTLTAERWVVDHVVAWIAEHWHVAPPQIGLWGVGMGGQGALRMAYKHPNKFPVVAAISPCVDFQRFLEAGDQALRQLYRDAEQARQDTATLHIHPLNWPRHQWFCCDPSDYAAIDGVERLRMKLFSLGVPHVCEAETSAPEGEAFVEQMAPEALRFLLERLEQERRRL